MGLNSLSIGDAAAFMGKGIANGVLSYAGVQSLGWVFNALSEKNSNQHVLEGTSQQLARIQKSMDDIESLQVHTLNRINELADALAEVYKGLKWENEIRSLQSRSSTIVSELTDPISKIKATFDYLQSRSKLDPAKVDAHATKLLHKTIDEILSPLNGIAPCLEKIHTSIVGDFGEKGILEVWSTLVAVGAKSENLSELFIGFENRFSYLLSLELLGITIMIDANHGKFGSNDTTVASEFWQNWKVKIIEQLDLFLRDTEKLVATRVDTLTGTEFNKFAYYPPFASTQSCASPPILQEADRLVQDLLRSIEGNSSTAHGLVTFRLFNYPNVTGKLPSRINIQLEEYRSKCKCSAKSIERKDGNTIEDCEFKTVPFEMALIKFDVPSGTYTIDNVDHPNLLGPQDYKVVNVSDSGTFESRVILASAETIKFYAEFTKPLPTYSYTSQWPKAVSVDDSGNVYLLSGGTITKFDCRGNIVGAWDMKNKLPTAMTVNKSGNIYVLRTKYKDDRMFSPFIEKYDSNGNFITSWGSYGSGIENFIDPVGIAVDCGGYVYVTDSGLHKVKKFETNGKFTMQWGTAGSGEGQFIQPTGIATDGNDNVYVSDHSRIQKFDPNGRFIAKWGEFKNAGGLAVDAVGKYVYATDLQTRSLKKFDLEGKLISEIPTGAYISIGFSAELAVDSSTGTLYTMDFAKDLLQVRPSVVLVSRNW